MRYRILIIFLFSVLITPTGLYARNQKMNSLRAGIGINVHDHYYGLSAGPSQFIEYNSVSLRYMVSPFAYLKWLDWIEIGVGLTYEYRNAMWKSNGNQFIVQDDGETVSYHRLTHEGRHHVGFDFPFRAYIIDNDRFELFLFYELKTIFYKNDYFWDYSNGGVMFGVKF